MKHMDTKYYLCCFTSQVSGNLLGTVSSINLTLLTTQVSLSQI
jgi:hypothetical protein